MTPDRAARLNGAVNRAFGEQFSFSARKASDDVDLPTVEDTSRPEFTFTGVFWEYQKRVTPNARGAVQNDNAHAWNSSMTHVVIDDTAPWVPSPGDIATRIKTGVRYEIAKSRPDGMGRIYVFLTAMSR